MEKVVPLLALALRLVVVVMLAVVVGGLTVPELTWMGTTVPLVLRVVPTRFQPSTWSPLAFTR